MIHNVSISGPAFDTVTIIMLRSSDEKSFCFFLKESVVIF